MIPSYAQLNTHLTTAGLIAVTTARLTTVVDQRVDGHDARPVRRLSRDAPEPPSPRCRPAAGTTAESQAGPASSPFRHGLTDTPFVLTRTVELP
jgi:hypothetical protein